MKFHQLFDYLFFKVPVGKPKSGHLVRNRKMYPKMKYGDEKKTQKNTPKNIIGIAELAVLFFWAVLMFFGSCHGVVLRYIQDHFFRYGNT